MTNELYLKRDDVINLFEEYQPRLATHVSEFGDALEDLKFRALESQPCEDAISRESVIEWLKDKDIIKTKKQEENARRELIKLPSVTPQTRWIPCGERLPERVEWYLTSIKWDDGTERVTISWFDGISFKAEVIAWMPLPEPYTESEEE